MDLRGRYDGGSTGGPAPIHRAAALEYMRLGWGLVLEFGATSCWETWDRHTSLCHDWSAAPAVILPAHVLGIRPLRPGFRAFAVDPRLTDLTRVRGRVPTPPGAIDVRWNLRDGAEEVRTSAHRDGGNGRRRLVIPITETQFDHDRLDAWQLLMLHTAESFAVAKAATRVPRNSR